MVKRKCIQSPSLHIRAVCAFAVVLLHVLVVHAASLSEYHNEIRQSITALDTLAQINETEDAGAYYARVVDTSDAIRKLLPKTQTVEWKGTTFPADNHWLHQELDRYKHATYAEQAEVRARILERLRAIDERLTDLEAPVKTKTETKDEDARKLAEVLRRPAYARNIKKQSALVSLFQRFMKWLQSLIPKPKPMPMGTVGAFSRVAQVIVIVIALVVLAFVLKLFLPRVLRARRRTKKVKVGPRIVLGETLAPDESAKDLLSEAELLARRGELRAAIRKGYIALLVELGERKLLNLARHKTNRDYLRAMREIEPLYGNVKQLTDAFELHWYGAAEATEGDWQSFRSAYEEALSM